MGGREGGGVGGGGGGRGQGARRCRAHEPAEEGSAFYPRSLSLSPHSVRCFEALMDYITIFIRIFDDFWTNPFVFCELLYVCCAI